MDDFIKPYLPEIFKLVLELTIVFLIVKHLSKSKKEPLQLSEAQIDQLVSEFEPAELVYERGQNPKLFEKMKIELADFDLFDLKNENKEIIKETITKYGVGPCGPRGFYGTFDVHLNLESKLAQIFCKENSVLYPNTFTAINSVISCFCKARDVIFYSSTINEAILRGISITKTKSIQFIDLNDLRHKILMYGEESRNNFVIVEGLSINSGDILDLPALIELRNQFKLRIILDESLSCPILGLKGTFSYFNEETSNVDLIIGSFSHYFASNGAFVVSDEYLAYYQRLASPSYCFSASLPVFIAQVNEVNLDFKFQPKKIFEITKFFIQTFEAKFKHPSFNGTSKLNIISSKNGPFVILSKQAEECYFSKLIELLSEEGVRVAQVYFPQPGIRLNFKVTTTKEEVCEVVDLLNRLE